MILYDEDAVLKRFGFGPKLYQTTKVCAVIHLIIFQGLRGLVR